MSLLRHELVVALLFLGIGAESAQNKQSTESLFRSAGTARHKASYIPGIPEQHIWQVDPQAVSRSGGVPSAATLQLPPAAVLQQGPANTVAALHSGDQIIPKVEVSGSKAAVSDGSLAQDFQDGEAMPQARWATLMRAYCSASFAGGLTVGVVGTLLVLSLGTDRQPGKSKSAMKEARPESEPQGHEVSNREDRAKDSVESIHRFGPRCGFLVAMLMVQSLSSLMLAGFQDLIQNHPSIIFFLTMVVGTGGNVGGQSVVLAVRRLAYGEEVSLWEQLTVGVQLAAVLAPLALLRAYAQGTKLAVCLTIGLATILIVILAAALGTALPKLLNQIRVDPAHATPVIQVLMDMVGVLVTCVIGHVVLDVMLVAPS